MDKLEALERLTRLRESGAITEEEYDGLKQELLTPTAAPPPIKEEPIPTPASESFAGAPQDEASEPNAGSSPVRTVLAAYFYGAFGLAVGVLGSLALGKAGSHLAADWTWPRSPLFFLASLVMVLSSTVAGVLLYLSSNRNRSPRVNVFRATAFAFVGLAILSMAAALAQARYSGYQPSALSGTEASWCTDHPSDVWEEVVAYQDRFVDYWNAAPLVPRVRLVYASDWEYNSWADPFTEDNVKHGLLHLEEGLPRTYDLLCREAIETSG